MRDDVKLTVDTLRYCEESGARCGECPSGVGENGVPNCHSQAHIADLIESLMAELEQVKRERDAAVEDLRTKAYYCETCAHYTPGYFCPGCRNKSNWEWRGVKEG